MSEFTDKGYAKNKLLDTDLKSNNYKLGTDKLSYATTHATSFKGEFV